MADKGASVPKEELVNLDAPTSDKVQVLDLPTTKPEPKDDKPGESDVVDPAEPLISTTSNGDPCGPRHDSTNSPSVRSPADKVRFILSPETESAVNEAEGSEVGANVLQEHSLFCQLDLLCHFEDGVMGWKEMARWLKYEEKVEAGDRWSKPHVATTSLHALFEIRKAIADNTAIVDLDLNASHGCVHQVAELLVERLRADRNLTEEQLNKVMEVLVKPHKHKHRQGAKPKPDTKVGIEDETGKSKAKVTSTAITDVQNNNNGNGKKKKFAKKDNLKEVSGLNYLYPGDMKPDDLKPYKPNKKMMGKIPAGSEVANMLVGQVDFIDEPIIAFIRLQNGSMLGDLAEVSLPTRFLFLVLAPPGSSSIGEYEEVGRAMAALFCDRVFCEVAYKAGNRQDLVDGIDEFIDDLTVLPPSVWDPATRLAPPQKTVTMDKIRKRLLNSTRHGETEAIDFAHAVSGDPTLTKTGKPFGGMIRDMKNRYGMYLSDIKDGLSVQCVASVVFLYFACITPIVTFGGLMGSATDGYMGTMETLLSGAICGTTFALFSGQPLTIVGATGPLLIFESIMYVFSRDYGFHYLAFRFWTGTWITAILILMVVFDLSHLVKYITRFTEESFSVLISLIFIAEAFKKLFHVMDHDPVNTDTKSKGPDFLCHCAPPPPRNETINPTDVNTTPLGVLEANATEKMEQTFSSVYNWTSLVSEDCINYQDKLIVSGKCVHAEVCTEHHWVLEGPACDDRGVTDGVPDVFFVCFVLFLATFGIAYFFRTFRTARYFPSIVRTTVADFAVFLSILICTGIDLGLGLETPKLMVPKEFKTTIDTRSWVVNPMAILPQWYIIILSLLPALLATILIFLDQQITAVIINRKEHKLLKPPGYHLDLFVLAILIFICSLLGLPWFVAATVRSITHVKSLIKQSEIKAPGEVPSMLGVREQRVTGLCIHLLIGVSVLMGGILRNVPMAVLYGVFLYMGVTSLGGVQFVERIQILLMPGKYMPDLIFLRHVPLKRIHIFTLIQIALMVCMWVVKSIKAVAITFPLLVLALCFVRKAMDYFFTQGEMFWLDHLLPEGDRRKKEDDMAEELQEEAFDVETQPLTAWPAEKSKPAKKEDAPVRSAGKPNSQEKSQRRPKV